MKKQKIYIQIFLWIRTMINKSYDSCLNEILFFFNHPL